MAANSAPSTDPVHGVERTVQMLHTSQQVGLGLLMLFSCGLAHAQEIDPMTAEREMGRDHYWRVVYENDFFAATDRYYTQGLLVEVVAPALRRLPVMRLLVRPAQSTLRFGVAFEDDGYTASDLKASEILVGDHPYAGTKQLRAFVVATDTARARRVTSGLTVGIIGPAAGGKQIQTFLHQRTGNTIPQGWEHQLRNDVIVNYDVAIAQRLLRVRNAVELNAQTGARIGTYNTSANLGATVLLGWLGPRGVPTSSRALFVYAKPTLEVTAYDATLQGGLFNRSSPYTIAARDLRRSAYSHRIGLVYRSGGKYVEYFRTYAAPGFRTGRAHRTGGVAVGWPLGR